MVSSTEEQAATGGPRLGLALAVLACAQLITALDFNIVYVALPEIGARLGFSPQSLQWVFSAYSVMFGGFLLLGGRAADLFGRRRMFIFGLTLYASSSLLGGLAQSPLAIVAARAVQGLGGAVLFPATVSLINTLFEEGPKRNRALSLWSQRRRHRSGHRARSQHPHCDFRHCRRHRAEPAGRLLYRSQPKVRK